MILVALTTWHHLELDRWQLACFLPWPIADLLDISWPMQTWHLSMKTAGAIFVAIP